MPDLRFSKTQLCVTTDHISVELVLASEITHKLEAKSRWSDLGWRKEWSKVCSSLGKGKNSKRKVKKHK